jgi:hypothetical protein
VLDVHIYMQIVEISDSYYAELFEMGAGDMSALQVHFAIGQQYSRSVH